MSARAGEPFRRRVRARLLGGLTRASGAGSDPFLRGLLWAAAAGARWSRVQKLVLANLALAYGDELDEAQRLALARRVRHHAARQLREWARLGRGEREAAWLDELVEVDASIAVLERLYAARRGVLVVTAHLGNWELLAATLRRRGFEGAVVGRRRARDSSSDWLVRMRAAWDVHSLPQDVAPREVLRVLRRGGVVGLLPDLDVRRLAGEFLPFFGVPALTMTAPAAIARTAALPLVPVRCVLAPDGGRYRLSVDEPLELDATLERRAATRALTERLNGVFEDWIRAAPEQWAWHQPRWRTRPGEHEPIPYAERRARKG